VRGHRAPAAADPKQLQAFPDPQPAASLSEEPAAKSSFHVKQDISPRGRLAAESQGLLAQSNQTIAKLLLDVVYALCEDGTLDRVEWAESLVALERLANGTA